MTSDTVHPIRANRLPLTTQTQRYLQGLVDGGTYQPGEQLPSEKELAAQLGISRSTLREALLNLEQEGVVVRRHGVGTFVAPGYEHRLESGLERLESIMELAARQEQQAQVRDLEIETVRASAELAERLQVMAGEELTSIRRAIIVDDRPVAYMADYVTPAILSPTEIREPFGGSVLDLLREKHGPLIAQAMANIVAINADRFLSKKLQVKAGQALLLLEETLFSDQGAPVEFSRNFFVPDFFQFHVVRR
jgi:GntR family transcriptional regulator